MLTFGNSKLKNSSGKVAAFSLPAGKTCPNAGECKKWCYAQVGSALYPRVKNHRESNYEASQSASFVSDMVAEIKTLKPSHVRIHDSGDFYSTEYMFKWRKIMQDCPEVTFYAYSKSWNEVGAVLGDLQNFTLIPSKGGLLDSWLSPSRPQAIVVPEGAELPTNCVEGSEDDIANLKAIQSGKSIALRAHGARKRKVA